MAVIVYDGLGDTQTDYAIDPSSTLVVDLVIGVLCLYVISQEPRWMASSVSYQGLFLIEFQLEVIAQILC